MQVLESYLICGYVSEDGHGAGGLELGLTAVGRSFRRRVRRSFFSLRWCRQKKSWSLMSSWAMLDSSYCLTMTRSGIGMTDGLGCTGQR